MKINVFTIRDKQTNELIYAEGVSHTEFCSDFLLALKWLTDNDLKNKNGSWYKSINKYGFKTEIRHLFNYEYDLIKFGLEEVEVQ